jgi:hypothetical protein
VHHATIYASKDPVALDAITLRRITKWRAKASLPPIGPQAAYIDMAAQMGLGNADARKIDIRNIGRAPNESE